MDKVKKTDPSNTAPSSKTFRDELRFVVDTEIVHLTWTNSISLMYLQCHINKVLYSQI
jgi:hypothetical protein